MLTRPMALRGGREPRLEAEPSALLPPPIKPGSLGNEGWRGGMEEKAFDGGAGEQSRSPGRPDAGIRGRRGQQTAGPSCGSLGLDHCFVTCSGTQSTDPPSIPHINSATSRGTFTTDISSTPKLPRPVKETKDTGVCAYTGTDWPGTQVPRKSSAPPRRRPRSKGKLPSAPSGRAVAGLCPLCGEPRDANRPPPSGQDRSAMHRHPFQDLEPVSSAC